MSVLTRGLEKYAAAFWMYVKIIIKEKDKCQVLSFKIRPAREYEMIHHFLASVIITAITIHYVFAPFKDVLNITVSPESYCIN